MFVCIELLALSLAPNFPRFSTGITRCRDPSASLGYHAVSPCDLSTASSVAGESVLPDGGAGHHWVAIMTTQNPLEPLALMADSPSPLVEVGQAAAVARLRPQVARVDQLLSSLPKESKESSDVLGLALDHILLAWLDHLQSSAGDCSSFESLSASASLHTAAVLEQRGFAEITSPDFSCLARGEPIATHEARLPAACIAYERMAGSGGVGALHDTYLYERILSALRDQSDPRPAGALPDAEAAPSAPPDDPWAAMKRANGF